METNKERVADNRTATDRERPVSSEGMQIGGVISLNRILPFVVSFVESQRNKKTKDGEDGNELDEMRGGECAIVGWPAGNTYSPLLVGYS